MLTALSLALSVFPNAQSRQTPTLTYETPAIRIEVALKELSKLSGKTLLASPDTRDEFLILRLKEVPVQIALDKIASATAAEWIPESSGALRLGRTPKLLQEQERQHIAFEANKIREAQAKLRAQLEKEGAFDQTAAKSVALQIEAMTKRPAGDPGNRDWQAEQRLGNTMPSGRLARALSATLDPNVLATMSTPGRIVFSSRPNAMQKPLSRESWTHVERYIRERATLVGLLPTFENERIHELPYSVYTLASRLKEKDTHPDKMLLVATRHEYGSGVGVEVMVANAAGQIIERGQTSLTINPGMGGEPGPPGTPPPGEQPIPLSERSTKLMKTIQEAMARGSGPESIPQLSPELLEVFLKPEEHTVSELTISDLLLGAGKAQNLNVVASPTDLLGFFASVLFVGGAPSPSQLKARMGDLPVEARIAQSDGWLELKPLDPYLARRHKVDRAALGKFVRSAYAKKRVALDELTGFVASLPEDFDRSLMMIYTMLSVPEASRTLERSPWPVLRLHASLSPAQRNTLASKGTLPYTQLLPAQKRIFHNIVYVNHNGMGQMHSSETVVPAEADEERSPNDTIRWQPTERYPNGVPGTATVSAQFESGGTILAKGTYGQHPTEGEMPVDQLAWHLWAAENPRPEWGERPQYTQYAYVEQVKIEYRLSLDKGMSFTGELKDMASAPVFVNSPDRLPAAVWEQVKKRLEEMRKGQKPPLQIVSRIE